MISRALTCIYFAVGYSDGEKKETKTRICFMLLWLRLVFGILLGGGLLGWDGGLLLFDENGVIDLRGLWRGILGIMRIRIGLEGQGRCGGLLMGLLFLERVFGLLGLWGLLGVEETVELDGKHKDGMNCIAKCLQLGVGCNISVYISLY